MGTGRIRSNRFYQRQTKERAWEGGRGGGGGGGGGREKERFLARLSWELDGNVASVITELADFKPMRRQITWPPFFPGTLRPTYF